MRMERRQGETVPTLFETFELFAYRLALFVDLQVHVLVIAVLLFHYNVSTVWNKSYL
jgi:hypothetical protein